MKYTKTSHVNIIEEIAKGMNAAGMNGAYLELGIAKARCFNQVAPYFKYSMAVDRSANSLKYVDCESSIVYKYNSTTDEFFKSYDGIKLDLIFIDARHIYKNVEKDFVNSLKVLKEDGIIILHDTYAPDAESAQHCMGAWKIQEHLKGEKNIQFINLPFYYGLTIVKKHTVKDWWIR